ncbi:outer membrane beta-barrel protein [Sunxiuqinia sp. sy24]|uniref:outer membrane beta-barrel protein n=1 Tax=Sunxiuqinia sp. sy24 TaxID=3461495 RepID=UPI00404646F9
MTKDNNQLDELFRSKLQNFEHEPPAYVWSRIREQQVGRKRRVLFFYLKGAGVAAAVLLAFWLGWQMQQQPGELTPVLSDRQVPVNEQAIQSDPGELGVETEGSSAVAEEPVQANAAYVQEVNEADVQNTIKSEGVTKRDPNLSIENSYALNRVSTGGEEQRILKRSTNMEKEPEPMRLLSLLNIQLDDSFEKQSALVEMSRKQREISSELNRLDQFKVEENARMLVLNRQAGDQQGWQVGAMLTPGMAVNEASQSPEYSRNMTVSNSKDNFQVGAGLAVEYKTKKRWSVQSGVYYSKLEQTSSNQPFQPENIASDLVGGEAVRGDAAYFNTAVAVKAGEMLMNTAAGVISIDRLPTNAKLSNSFESLSANDGILLTETEFEQNFEYIEIPLIFRYQLIDAVFDLQVLGGFNTSVLVGNNAYASSQYGSERIGETRDMNRLNYSTSVGLGLGYGISDKISLHVEPQLKYFLGSLNGNADVDFKPYTIGVSTGLSYQF